MLALVTSNGPARQLLRALGLILALCVAIRVAAWLVEPLLPAVLVLLVLIGIYRIALGLRRDRW